MKKKIMSIIVWALLAVVGAWVVITICLAVYLYTALNDLPFVVGLSVFVAVFLAVFLLVVKAVHILGMGVTNRIYPNEKAYF